METRIYVVMQTDKPHRLVEATSAAQAIRHCASKEYSAKIARPKDVAGMLAVGTKVENANESEPSQKQIPQEEKHG